MPDINSFYSNPKVWEEVPYKPTQICCNLWKLTFNFCVRKSHQCVLKHINLAPIPKFYLFLIISPQVISSPQILYFLFQLKSMTIFTKFTMNIRPLEFNLCWMQEVAVRRNGIANIEKLYCNMQHRHEIFLFSRASRPSLWPIQPPSYPIDTWDCFWEILQPKHEGYHSTQSSSKVKNLGLYTSTSQHLHGENRSNLFLVRTCGGGKLCTVNDLYKNR